MVSNSKDNAINTEYVKYWFFEYRQHSGVKDDQYKEGPTPAATVKDLHYPHIID